MNATSQSEPRERGTGRVLTEEEGPLLPDFTPFDKIPRLFRDMIITEKIDGTNAAVVVTEDGVFAQSRKRVITPAQDNFGFAKWVQGHEVELRDGLGLGVHFGEWWGAGIQRGYGLEDEDKRFSLFNTKRWHDERPDCCSVVPLLGIHTFDLSVVKDMLTDLDQGGSLAAPGFKPAEGVCVYLPAANQIFKATIKDDERGKEFGA